MTVILHVKPISCTFNKSVPFWAHAGVTAYVYTVPISTYGFKKANPRDNVFQLPTEYLKSRFIKKYCIY